MSKTNEGLAKSRERRSNAGSKMSSLLDREEVVDDFYKTTYGGFEEEVNDNDYTSEDSSDSGDEIDSDFDIDENDEPISDDNDDKEKSRSSKRKSVYKEPKPIAKRVDTKPKADDTRNRGHSSGVSRNVGRRTTPTDTNSTAFKTRISPKKSFRESTRRNARETEHRLKVARKESELRRKSGRRPDSEYRQLSQTEMLREAKKTELINLKSLERYRKLELEKSKKNKIVKQVPKGPYVRYQSVTMPLIEEIPHTESQGKEAQEEQTTEGSPTSSEALTKCCRTFISFTDEQTFRKYFPDRKAPQPKQKLFCPISHLPGRYFDPVSLLPYSSAPTFRAIREAYYKQLEQLGDQRQPEVAKWIQWRKRTSAQRPNIQPRIIRIIK